MSRVKMLLELFIELSRLLRVVLVNFSCRLSILDDLLLTWFILLEFLKRVQFALYLHLHISHVRDVICKCLIGLQHLTPMRHRPTSSSRPTRIILLSRCPCGLVNTLNAYS